MVVALGYHVEPLDASGGQATHRGADERRSDPRPPLRRRNGDQSDHPVAFLGDSKGDVPARFTGWT
jgi:hypothetical protein